MLKSYFITTLRSLRKHPVFTVVNVIGLSVGIAAFILITVFVRDELTFDRFHKNHDRIYRAMMINKDGKPQPFPTDLIEIVNLSMPEVEALTRIQVFGETLMDYEGAKVFEKETYGADPNFFKIFDFSLKYGNESNALKDENSVVLSRYMALKYFGQEDVIGRKFEMADNDRIGVVTGVLNDVPQNSRFQFNIIVPIRKVSNGGYRFGGQGELYALLKEPVDEAGLESKLMELTAQNGFDNKFNLKFKVENYGDLHLESEFSQTASGVKGNKEFIFIFSAVGLLLLLLAVINYINSSTAKSLSTLKQVGIRKVIGATKTQIRFQFLIETALLVVVAVFLAAALAEYFLPTLNSLSGKSLKLNYFSDGFTLTFLTLLIPGITLFAGVYPAIFTSRFKTLRLMKGEAVGGKGLFRKYLVAFQLTITLVLLFGTQVIKQQVDFFVEGDIGMDPSSIITTYKARGSTYDVMKAAFEKIPGVEAVTASPFPLNGTVKMPLQWTLENEQKTDAVPYQEVAGNALDVLGIQLIRGRDFISGSVEDENGSVIINQAMVGLLGFEEPLGQKIKLLSPNYRITDYTIIGIAENLVFNLKQEATPAVIMQAEKRLSSINIKLSEGVKTETIPFLSQAWNKISPNTPFVYTVMADEIEANYEKEKKFGTVIQVFTWVAMLIAGLGLFSLSAFTIIQRYKEIGIRKVLGASVFALILSFLRSYLGLILLASLIAIPTAYYLMNLWMNDFVNHVEISSAIFAIGIGASLLIVLITVGYQSVKASLINPVDILRNE